MTVKPVWAENGKVYIIDQTRLPGQYMIREILTVQEMFDAIACLAVRGAPAIGIAASFGVYLGVKETSFTSREEFISAVASACDTLSHARPTAVNLFWALRKIKECAETMIFTSREASVSRLYEYAQSILSEDIRSGQAIGCYGAPLLTGKGGILTHCNAGGLASSGYGTALAPIYVLQERGEHPKVCADETRPLLQGARLTVWELMQAGVDVTLLCDNMAGDAMRRGLIGAVIVGADRITQNGDTANKIGTYSLSVLAKAHGIPFYVAAPFSTIDFETSRGDEIQIEQRSADEVRCLSGQLITCENVPVLNPAFDVTPGSNITAIITDRGVITPPFMDNLKRI